MKIKITSSANGLWYKDKIGQEFEVRTILYQEDPIKPYGLKMEVEGFVVRGDDSLGAYKLLNIVYPEHCEIVESKEV